MSSRDRIDLVGGRPRPRPRLPGALQIVAEGGRYEPFLERIAVEEAKAATIILAAATSFRGGDPKAVVERQLAAAAAKRTSG